MAEDIKKTGPVGLRGLTGLNRQPQAADDDLPTLEQLKAINKAYATGAVGPSLDTTTSTVSYGIDSSMGNWGTSQYDEGILNAPMDAGQIGDTRYENQPWYDVLANGVGKMFGKAGTTFVSSLVGLPYGLFQVARTGNASSLWNNDVTQGLSNVDKWMEENMTNYQSQEQQQDPYFRFGDLNWWADNVITNAGFTLGAAASMAVGSGSLGLMSKALGFVNDVGKTTKAGAAFLSSLFSATGEGMIEAKQGVEERNKLEYQKLDDTFAPEKQALEEEFNLINQEYEATRGQSLVRGTDGKLYDPAYEEYKLRMGDLNIKREELQQKYDAGRQQIEESGQRMGNVILGLNQALLTAGNLIQFGKGMVKSFDSARHVAEVSSNAAKPFSVWATKVGADLKDGYKVVGKTFGKAMITPKNMVKEGAEEMNQQWIQSGAGAYYEEKDVNDYWKAKLDPDAYKDTVEGLHTIGSAVSQGFKKSWGDFSQYEQFLIGAMTGAGGIYMPTRIFNQDKTKSRLDPRRYGEWSGGIWQDISEYNKQVNQYQENIDDLNKILASEDFPSRVRSAVGHTYTQGEKDAAVESDDKKAWKDADDKQMIHDIQAFLRAGKLDDLRTIYNEIGSQLSDEDVQNIIKSTTKEITAEEDKQNFDRHVDEQISAHQIKITELQNKAQSIGDSQSMLEGAEIVDYQVAVRPELEKIFGQIDAEYDAISQLEQKKEQYVPQRYFEGAYVDKKGNVTASEDEIKKILKHNSEELNRKLDSYLNSISTVQEMTKGQLTKDQEDNLAYLHNISAEKTARVDKIMSKVRKQMPSKFLLKTEKAPEQLAKQFASSDLAFTKDEKTKKGYVEVDTSLMNDKAFASFFLDNIIDLKKTGEKDSNGNDLYKIDEQPFRQAFVENAMQKNGQSLAQALSSKGLDDMINDIYDAVQLHSEAAEFYNTYLEYMLNPSKVDKDKAKEEKRAEENQKKDKVDGASLDDMLKMSDVDLGSILSDGKKGKNKSEKKARKAIGMKNGKSKVQKELDAALRKGMIDEETAEDAMRLFDEQLRRMQKEDDTDTIDSMDNLASKMFDTETEAMNDPEILLNADEIDAINNGDIEFDEAAFDERISKAKDILNAISDPISKELSEIEDSIDKGVLNKALDDDDTVSEKADAAVSKMIDQEKDKQQPKTDSRSKNRGEDSEPLRPVNTILPTREDVENDTITSEGSEEALVEDKKLGQAGKNVPQTEKNSRWHPWMSSTSEVANTTNEPYEPFEGEENAEFKKRRYDVIREKLYEVGAYERRRKGMIKPNMKVGFKVFQDVNDASGDFVIFVTDSNGVILGDMPSNDPRLATSKRDIPMDDIYNKIKEEWEDADDDDRKEGMQSSLYTEIDHVLVGKVLYQDTRQTVKQLTEGKVEPLFAILGNDGVIITGQGKEGMPKIPGILPPKTGNIGQPYVLIQTPNFHSNLNPGFRYYTVPISTKRIGNLDNSYMFTKVLKTLLDKIKQGSIEDSVAKKVLQELVAVGNVHVNFNAKDKNKKGLGIRVTSFNRALGSEAGMPQVIFSGNREGMDVNAVMESLGKFQVNVSADYINGNDGKNLRKYLTIDGKPLDSQQYNQMIAEVAETDAASPETVNDWFTVKPLEKVGDTFKMAESDENMPTWKDVESYERQVVTVQDGKITRDWEVRPSDGYKVYDENDVEIVLFGKDKNHTKKEQAEAERIAAEVFGKFTLKNREESFAVVLGGKTRIYNPKTRTFHTPKTLEKKGYDYKALLEIKNNTELSEHEKWLLIQEALGRKIYNWDGTEATSGTDESSVDHSEEVTEKINKMREDASHYHLVKWDEGQQKYVEDEEGDYYKNDITGNIHARVSNINEADEEVIRTSKSAGFNKGINPQLKTVSTGSGNVVDRFVRDFFRNGRPLNGIGVITRDFNSLPTEIKGKIEDIINSINEPNISLEEARILAIDLHNFSEKMGPDWEIDSTGIVASGIVSFDSNSSVNVAGTIDLLAYNKKEGKYGIIDMKTSLAEIFTKDEKVKSDAKTRAKLEHWRAQQTLYKNFLEQKFGIKISGIRILPFNVNYSTKFNETDYTIEGKILKDRGYIVDISPKYMGKTIAITPKTSVKYKMGQLPESVKRIMSNKAISKPDVDKEVAVKSQLIQLRDMVPDGATLKDFILKEYADNQDVLKLVDILEKNKGNNKPVMMTSASQNLILKALDLGAIDKAVQEDAARKQQLSINVPKEEEWDRKKAISEMSMYGIKNADIELLNQLPEELLIKAAKSKTTAINCLDILMETDGDIEEVESYLRSLPSSATRHRKAKDGNYRKLDLQKELRWLTQNIPQVSRERRLHIVKGLIACSDGTMDFGKVENGIMTIGTQAEEGTVYHEAFHYVVQFLMSDKEINTLFEAATLKYGNIPIVALEEKLADDFADYVNGIDPNESRIRKFFRELWNAIRQLFNNSSYIETLFRNINTGVYSGDEYVDDRNNAFSTIMDKQRQVSRNYEYLTNEEKQSVSDSGVSVDAYNDLQKEQQDYLLNCAV